MRKAIRRLFRSSYYLQLVLSHLLITVITISIIAAFNFSLARNQQNRRMLEVIGSLGQQTASRINVRLEEMENVSETVRYTLQKLLDATTGKAPQPQLEAEAINTLRTLRDSFFFTDITAWMPESLFSSGEGITFYNINQANSRAQTESVLKAPYNRLCWMATFDYSYPMMRFGRNRRFNLISCFVRVSTLTSPGAFCYFIDIDEREIAGILGNSGDMPVEQFVVDDRGRIISHPDVTRLSETLSAEKLDLLTKLQPGENMPIQDSVYMSSPLRIKNWTLVTAVSRDYLLSIPLTSANGILPAIVVASLAAMLVSLFVSRQMTRKMTDMKTVIRSIAPTFNLTNESVDLIQTRMPEPLPDQTPDVLDELAMTFNRLIDRLNTTMQEALSISINQEKLRYQLLRAKINPHFLYNMLDSIKICNSLNRTEDANTMLVKLASFYRLILRKNDLDIITIGEELEIIRLYLEMEAISHENAFTFNIETDPDIGYFKIPRFVLQPLVENCVTHGLPDVAKPMHIAIILRYEDDAICITIEDNGLGMDEATMSHLIDVIHGKGVPASADRSTQFWGLHNVSARIKPYVVNPDDPILYESAIGQGTTLKIHLRQIL